MVGMSLTFSRRLELRPALVRALKLVGLGLLLNLYPYFPIAELRWPGVLQRIGICYLAAWAAKRWLRPRGQVALVAVLVVGYWALMTRVSGPEGHPPNLEMQTNLSAQVDRIFLVPHVWSHTKTWDPRAFSPPCPRSRPPSSACSPASGCDPAAGRSPSRWASFSPGSRSPPWACCGERRRRRGFSSR